MAVKVTGMKELQSVLRNAPIRGRKALAGALYQEGLHVLRDAVPRTPVVTGRLRNSKFATVPSWTNLEMTIGFGTKYAWMVHEGIKTRVKNLPRSAQKAFFARAEITTSSRSGGSMATWKVSEVGGPKFLEAAVDATATGRQSRMFNSFNRLFAKRMGVRADAKTKSRHRDRDAKGRFTKGG